MSRGASLDLVELIDGVEFDPDTQTLVDALLDPYERRELDIVQRMHGDFVRLIGVGLDVVDDFGLRDLDPMALMMLFSDGGGEDMIARLRAIFDEETKPMQRLAIQAAELNISTYKRLEPYLPTEDSDRIREQFLRRVYRIDSAEHTLQAFRRAIGEESLDPALRGAITQQRDAFIASDRRAVEELMGAIDSMRVVRTMAQLERERGRSRCGSGGRPE